MILQMLFSRIRPPPRLKFANNIDDSKKRQKAGCNRSEKNKSNLHIRAGYSRWAASFNRRPSSAIRTTTALFIGGRFFCQSESYACLSANKLNNFLHNYFLFFF
jgi:hypothetical protein